MADPIFNITMIGDRALVLKAGRMPAAVKERVRRVVTEEALRTEARIKEKLSGEVLNVRTGDLRRSITHRVEEDAESVTGRVFSSGDVKYAAIHEFGGTIQIPEIFPKNGQALHFFVGSSEVFAAHTRAHTVTMPERSYMRSTLRERSTDIKEALIGAVREGLDKA